MLTSFYNFFRFHEPLHEQRVLCHPCILSSIYTAKSLVTRLHTANLQQASVHKMADELVALFKELDISEYLAAFQKQKFKLRFAARVTLFV